MMRIRKAVASPEGEAAWLTRGEQPLVMVTCSSGRWGWVRRRSASGHYTFFFQYPKSPPWTLDQDCGLREDRRASAVGRVGSLKIVLSTEGWSGYTCISHAACQLSVKEQSSRESKLDCLMRHGSGLAPEFERGCSDGLHAYHVWKPSEDRDTTNTHMCLVLVTAGHLCMRQRAGRRKRVLGASECRRSM